MVAALQNFPGRRFIDSEPIAEDPSAILHRGGETDPQGVRDGFKEIVAPPAQDDHVVFQGVLIDAMFHQRQVGGMGLVVPFPEGGGVLVQLRDPIQPLLPVLFDFLVNRILADEFILELFSLRPWRYLWPRFRIFSISSRWPWLLHSPRFTMIPGIPGRPHPNALMFSVYAEGTTGPKTEEPGPPVKGSPGSTTFRWWALQDLNL